MRASEFAWELVCVGALLAASVATKAEEPDQVRLVMFGDQVSPRGLWRMEFLEATDPEVAANMKSVGGVAVCMNAASEMGKSIKQLPGAAACTNKILKNTPTVAQLETQCSQVSTTLVTMTKESRESFRVEIVETKKDGAREIMKSRYRYAGACKEQDGVIKLDKNSPACKQMRAEMAELNLEATCAEMPADQQAACLKQVKESLAATRGMCE